MAFKKIRDLEAFDGTTPLNTGDFLVVSDADGESTRRTTIKEAVSSYNLAVTEELQAQPDTITNSDGQEVPNPLADIVTQVEVVDTNDDGLPDTEILLDTTPITSENIDKLVKPGGGLEVIEVCKDIEGTIVDCTIGGNPNPQVAIKSKQLSFAVSSASKSIIIYCNGNTGIEYSSSGDYTVSPEGEVSTKFINLWNAYRYIRQKIASKDTTVTIRVETDLDEGKLGPINTDDTRGQGAYSSNGLNSVNIIGWDSINQTHSLYNGELRKISVLRVSSPDKAQAMFWFNSRSENIWGIHFALDCEDHTGLHSIFRSSGVQGNITRFYSCKCTFRGSTHLIFESSRGGNIEFHNFEDSISRVDPLGKGFYMPCFEFQVERKEDNSLSYSEALFGADSAGSIRIVEYSGTAFHSSNTRWQNRFHFSKPQNYTLGKLILLESASLFEINSSFSADAGDTNNIVYSKGYIFHAFGFNTFIFNGTTYEDATQANFGFVADINNDDLVLFNPGSLEGTDYAYQSGNMGDLSFAANNATARVHKSENGQTTSLTNYFPNHTF